MNRQAKSVVDLRPLPDVVFGPRDIMWWGTLGFVIIEGFTLVLCAAAYVYLTYKPPTSPTAFFENRFRAWLPRPDAKKATFDWWAASPDHQASRCPASPANRPARGRP